MIQLTFKPILAGGYENFYVLRTLVQRNYVTDINLFVIPDGVIESPVLFGVKMLQWGTLQSGYRISSSIPILPENQRVGVNIIYPDTSE